MSQLFVRTGIHFSSSQQALEHIGAEMLARGVVHDSYPAALLEREATFPTGIALEIPAGFAGLIYARSGLACKQGLAPANKVGVIDPDYRGEVLIALHNHSDAVRTVEPGDRIAQLILTPYLTADFQLAEDLTETDRGAGGFGSTGGK